MYLYISHCLGSLIFSLSNEIKLFIRQNYILDMKAWLLCVKIHFTCPADLCNDVTVINKE